jgi:hypothetical protein
MAHPAGVPRREPSRLRPAVGPAPDGPEHKAAHCRRGWNHKQRNNAGVPRHCRRRCASQSTKPSGRMPLPGRAFVLPGGTASRRSYPDPSQIRQIAERSELPIPGIRCRASRRLRELPDAAAPSLVRDEVHAQIVSGRVARFRSRSPYPACSCRGRDHSSARPRGSGETGR